MSEESEQKSDGATTSPPPGDAVAKKKGRLLPSGFATLRDVICFAFGTVILVNEVFFSKTVEPYALGVGIALMGLPLVFGADERKAK